MPTLKDRLLNGMVIGETDNLIAKQQETEDEEPCCDNARIVRYPPHPGFGLDYSKVYKTDNL